jgi:hypothetical protein
MGQMGFGLVPIKLNVAINPSTVIVGWSSTVVIATDATVYGIGNNFVKKHFG